MVNKINDNIYMPKKVILVYESHSDISATKAISENAKLLSELGIKSFAIEKGSDEKPFDLESLDIAFQANIEKLFAFRELAKDETNLEKINNTLFKIFGIETPDDFVHSIENYINVINRIILNLTTEYESNMLLYQACRKQTWDAFSMDLPTSASDRSYAKRDREMAKNILKKVSSLSDGEGVLVLVGAAHHMIREFFRKNTDIDVVEVLFECPNKGSELENRMKELLLRRISSGRDKIIEIKKDSEAKDVYFGSWIKTNLETTTEAKDGESERYDGAASGGGAERHDAASSSATPDDMSAVAASASSSDEVPMVGDSSVHSDHHSE
jgi:hypothetical protein